MVDLSLALSSFLHVWLRDNCRCSVCYHAVAEERILDSSSIDLDLQPKSVTLNTHAQTLDIEWDSKDAHTSSFPFAFLAHYTPFSKTSVPRSETLWSVADIERDLPTLPRVTFASVMESEQGVLVWLELLDKYGFTIVGNVSYGRKRVEEVGRRISIIRNSFWGESSWDVTDKPDPTSLSLTGGDLFPHTDLCFSDSQPGVQFLHCLEFTADKMIGGESTIVDGYYVAEKIRREDPDAFEVLTTAKIPHVFSSKNHYFRYDGPVISLNADGSPQEVRFNQALIAPIEAADNTTTKRIYRATQVFAKETRDAANLLHFRLREGEMLVFNNRRMLHGRRGYDAVNTRRYLEGCYLDYEEFVGRLKKLCEANRAMSTRI